VFSKCGGSSSSTGTGFDYSSSNLPTMAVDSASIPTYSFTATFPAGVIAPTLTTSPTQFASVVYDNSVSPYKLGIALAQYSTNEKLMYRILLNFDDAWATALPTATETDTHVLSNGTATLMVTTTEGQAPHFYTISIPTVSTVTITYYSTKPNTSTLSFFVYTLAFPSAITLDFTSKGGPSVTLGSSITASGTSN
jgi:hypothetical protein